MSNFVTSIINFKGYCPKCRSKNLGKISESFPAAFKRNLLNVMFPIRFFTGYAKKPVTRLVCQDCGFDWEKVS